MKNTRKIGILGGTFDPIHNAHLALGEQAYRQFKLDEVVFLPASQPPHKAGKRVTDAEDRLRMTQLAVEGYPYFSCSDEELHREGYSYTADTLKEMNEAHPENTYYFIMGGDSLFNFETWYHPERILANSIILAAARDDHHMADLQIIADRITEHLGGRIYLISMDEMEISSTEVRDRIAKGMPAKHLIPERVQEYLTERDIYRTAEEIELEKRFENRPLKKSERPICKILKKSVSIHRYAHTMGVAAMAMDLADIYGADREKALRAGLLHDCAKGMKAYELHEFAVREQIPISEAEEKEPSLLHAKVGAWIAKRVYDERDPEILAAIACHTTGKPDMTLLEKIVFTADYLEPGRDRAPHLAVLRKLVKTDLDLTIQCILQDTLEYLKNNRSLVDPMTEETYRWMLLHSDEKKEG